MRLEDGRILVNQQPLGPLGPDVAVIHILAVTDPARSRDFWVGVLGAEPYREYGGTSVVLRLAGSWFMAGVAIAQQFGRPHTPQDQAWIETLFGHIKGEWTHLEKIRDPGELDAELDRVRSEYNAVRLHASIGYVTPDDEHDGRGDAIRQQRRDGLAAAREARITYRQNTTHEENQ